jgi:adenylate cyclase class 2
MPIEIEAKLKVAGPEPVIKALEAAGAVHVGDHIETDSFFDTRDRTLLAGDRGLRLRIARNLNTNESQCILTHKGPVGHGPLKKREETETAVGNAEAMSRLLEQLGFIQWLRYQKKRRSWKLDECKVEVDEIPHLGHFVEIEGPSDEAVMKVRERLGLSAIPLIKASYVSMLSAHLQERGESISEVLLPST